MGADPDRTAFRLEQSHDARRADGVRIAGCNGYRLQLVIGREPEQPTGHRADPKVAVAVTQE